MTYEYEYQEAIRELRDQGLTVEIRTPEDGTWVVCKQGETFIITQHQMADLRRVDKLTLAGIRELDEYLKTQKAKV